MKNISTRLESLWRKQLLSYAKGHVLEVSVGEGLNFPYYPQRVKVTATDTSARIIEKARKVAIDKAVNARFVVSPVGSLQLPPHSFDTIVSTFSLCACENPVQVLNRFNEWCKPGGNILLLEHGLSNLRGLQWLQQKCDNWYYKKSGCHLDKNIKAVLECAEPTIKRIERKAAGIIYMAWLNPA